MNAKRSTAKRKTAKAANIAIAAQLREELAAKSRLPKAAYKALISYAATQTAHNNSRHLDKLVKLNGKVEPAAEPAAPSQKLHRETHSWQNRLTQKHGARPQNG